MSGDQKIGLHIGLRFKSTPDREICDRIFGFLGEIERLEEKYPIPLFWNFPVAPVLDNQNRSAAKLIAKLGRRVADNRDRIVPSGFSGAAHPLLLPEELKQELLWCYRNPWFPALENLFQLHPDSVLPFYPDLFGEAVKGVYSRHGFRLIGIPIPLYRVFSFSGGNRRKGPKLFSSSAYRIPGSKIRLSPIAVVRPEDTTAEIVPALLASSRKMDSLGLLFDMEPGKRGDESQQPAAALGIINMISRQRRIEFLPWPEQVQKNADTPVDPAELLKYSAPLFSTNDRSIRAGAEEVRKKKRKSNLQVRRLLTSLAEATGALSENTADTDGASLEITNISMAGSVTLIGDGSQQATFNQGKLTNLINHGREILGGMPAQSFFATGVKRDVLKTESAFSFEREGQTGLRSILSARIARDQQDIRVVLDTYFGEEHGCLRLDLTVHYPFLADRLIRESAPLELCLCSFTEDDNLLIEAELPERGCYNQAVAPKQSITRLYGKIFRIQKGAEIVELEAAPEHKYHTEPLEFRAAKQRGAYRLLVNLGGSYLPLPGRCFSARAQNLAYAIRSGGTKTGSP